jgi:hypothetical protein
MSESHSTVPPVPDSDRVLAIFGELQRQREPKRAAAERAEREILVAKYPGQYVAYLDEWDGEHLTRAVLAASRSIAEVHAQLRALPNIEAIRHTMVVTQIRDPEDDAISVPWFTIESIEDEPQQEAGDGGSRIPS